MTHKELWEALETLETANRLQVLEGNYDATEEGRVYLARRIDIKFRILEAFKALQNPT